jgi:hypothetical protein
MSIKPLIFDYKEVLVDSKCNSVYCYDHDLSLNVVMKDGEKITFISLGIPATELVTKTRVKQEQDDQQSQLELLTKTKVKAEQDDYSNLYLEMVTKTFVKQETDDERSLNHY